jgi:hypothetical protein
MGTWCCFVLFFDYLLGLVGLGMGGVSGNTKLGLVLGLHGWKEF